MAGTVTMKESSSSTLGLNTRMESWEAGNEINPPIRNVILIPVL